MYVRGKQSLQILFAKEGCSMDVLAEKVGVCRITVTKMVKKQPVQSKMAKKVCDAFGVDMMDYFELVEEESK